MISSLRALRFSYSRICEKLRKRCVVHDLVLLLPSVVKKNCVRDYRNASEMTKCHHTCCLLSRTSPRGCSASARRAPTDEVAIIAGDKLVWERQKALCRVQ